MFSISQYLQQYLFTRGVKISRYQKKSKLKEETYELLEAINMYKRNRSSKNLDHLKAEVADVVWCDATIN